MAAYVQGNQCDWSQWARAGTALGKGTATECGSNPLRYSALPEHFDPDLDLEPRPVLTPLPLNFNFRDPPVP